MQVICLEDAAFYALIENVVTRLQIQKNVASDKWISGEEAMKLLRITSKTTLQKLRDEDQIVYTSGTPVILYDVDSINAYLKNKSKRPY